MGAQGLLRLPAYWRSIVVIMQEQSMDRVMPPPSLRYPGMSMHDLNVAVTVAIALFGLRILMDRVILRALLVKHAPRNRAKLSEAMFYTMYYIAAFSFFALVVCPEENWLHDFSLLSSRPIVRDIFDPYPPARSDVVHTYYMQALGFYSSAMFFLVLFDTRRSDFGQLFLHHVVTLALIGLSFFYGYVRGGIVIIALHDFGDIFLYLATSLNKLGYTGLDTAVFATFAAAFYVTRLIMLPRIIWCILVESLNEILIEYTFNNWAIYFEGALWHLLAFFVLLNTLIVLHCFWFTLILRMIHREVFLGKTISKEGDIREDDSDDE
jgi:hypothetical protein